MSIAVVRKGDDLVVYTDLEVELDEDEVDFWFSPAEARELADSLVAAANAEDPDGRPQDNTVALNILITAVTATANRIILAVDELHTLALNTQEKM